MFVNYIVHELGLKNEYLVLAGREKIMLIIVTSECLLSKKVRRALRLCSFWQKFEVFYRPEWNHMQINFEYLQIQNRILNN